MVDIPDMELSVSFYNPEMAAWPATPSPGVTPAMTPSTTMTQVISLEQIRRVTAPFVDQMLQGIHRVVLAEMETFLRMNMDGKGVDTSKMGASVNLRTQSPPGKQFPPGFNKNPGNFKSPSFQQNTSNVGNIYNRITEEENHDVECDSDMPIQIKNARGSEGRFKGYDGSASARDSWRPSVIPNSISEKIGRASSPAGSKEPPGKGEGSREPDDYFSSVPPVNKLSLYSNVASEYTSCSGIPNIIKHPAPARPSSCNPAEMKDKDLSVPIPPDKRGRATATSYAATMSSFAGSIPLTRVEPNSLYDSIDFEKINEDTEDENICRHWKTKGYCKLNETCKFSHPPSAIPIEIAKKSSKKKLLKKSARISDTIDTKMMIVSLNESSEEMMAYSNLNTGRAQISRFSSLTTNTYDTARSSMFTQSQLSSLNESLVSNFGPSLNESSVSNFGPSLNESSVTNFGPNLNDLSVTNFGPSSP